MSISAPTQPLVEPPTQQLFICRQCIPSVPDVLWRIERGAVRTVTWSEDNTFSGLGYWGPGDIVGHPRANASKINKTKWTKSLVHASHARISFSVNLIFSSVDGR